MKVMTKNVFGQLILLEAAVKDLRRELTRDVMIDCPSTIKLALEGLESQVSKIVKLVQEEIGDAT